MIQYKSNFANIITQKLEAGSDIGNDNLSDTISLIDVAINGISLYIIFMEDIQSSMSLKHLNCFN